MPACFVRATLPDSEQCGTSEAYPGDATEGNGCCGSRTKLRAGPAYERFTQNRTRGWGARGRQRSSRQITLASFRPAGRCLPWRHVEPALARRICPTGERAFLTRTRPSAITRLGCARDYDCLSEFRRSPGAGRTTANVTSSQFELPLNPRPCRSLRRVDIPRHHRGMFGE
jgi:hypothetical protein